MIRGIEKEPKTITKTKMVEKMIAGLMSGSVMFNAVRKGPAPVILALNSVDASIDLSADSINK